MLSNLIYIGLIYVIARMLFQLALPSWIPILKLLGGILVGITIITALNPVFNIFAQASTDFHEFVQVYKGVTDGATTVSEAVTDLPGKTESLPIIGITATKYPPGLTFKEKIWPYSKEYFSYPTPGQITQGFQGDQHHGIDIACEEGTYVKAAREGEVLEVGKSEIYGNYIILDHGGNWHTLYAHLSEIAVAKGQHIWGQSFIGKSGNTGKSDGPHLHFEIRVGGKAINPIEWMK